MTKKEEINEFAVQYGATVIENANTSAESQKKVVTDIHKTGMKNENTLHEQKTQNAKDQHEQKDRFAQIEKQKEDKNLKDFAKKSKDILKDFSKDIAGGLLGGYGIGAILDNLIPRKELDDLAEVRREFMVKWGKEGGELYAKAKADMFQFARQTAKDLGVSIYSDEEITDGLRKAINSNISKPMIEEFSKVSMQLHEIGVEIAEDTAKNMVVVFGDSVPAILNAIGNVIASSNLTDQMRDKVAEATTAISDDVAHFQKDEKARANSMANYTAALSSIEENNLLNLDQSKKLTEILTNAGRGDVEAKGMLAKLGLDPEMISEQVRQGDWGVVFEQVLTGMSTVGGDGKDKSLVMKAMGLDDADLIAKALEDKKSKVVDFHKTVDTMMIKSKEVVGDYNQMELHSKEIMELNWMERFKNWATTTQLVEEASDLLEKLNIDAGTAATVLGGFGGLVKNAFQMFVGPALTAGLVGASTGTAALGTSLLAAGASAGLFALEVVLIAGAIYLAGRAIYKLGKLIYDNWDFIKEMAMEKVEAIKESISTIWTGMKDGFLTAFDGVKGIIQQNLGIVWEHFKSSPLYKVYEGGKWLHDRLLGKEEEKKPNKGKSTDDIPGIESMINGKEFKNPVSIKQQDRSLRKKHEAPTSVTKSSDSSIKSLFDNENLRLMREQNELLKMQLGVSDVISKNTKPEKPLDLSKFAIS